MVCDAIIRFYSIVFPHYSQRIAKKFIAKRFLVAELRSGKRGTAFDYVVSYSVSNNRVISYFYNAFFRRGGASARKNRFIRF